MKELENFSNSRDYSSGVYLSQYKVGFTINVEINKHRWINLLLTYILYIYLINLKEMGLIYAKISSSFSGPPDDW